MGLESNKWNLTRKPNKFERIVGFIAGLLGCIGLLLLVIIFVILSFEEPVLKNFIPMTIFFLLLMVTVRTLYKVIFSQPKKLSGRAVIWVSGILIITGIVNLGVGFFTEHMSWSLGLLGVIAIGVGLVNLKRVSSKSV